MKDLKTVITGYFSLNDYLIPQQEAEQVIREGVSFRGPNILILVFAILIASLGLNTNSTAVIIGAMLISPLMGPIIGLGLGVGVSDFPLLKRSFRNLVVAAAFSVLASTLYFLISPVSEGHSELLARTSPTIYDVLIGFFGGAAGIVAIASKSKGNVIPGVAIATALMPPLCTVGYGLATWQPHYFFGALYLFLINSIYICLATFIGIKLIGFTRVETALPERARKMRRLIFAIAVLTMLPSIYLTYDMLKKERFEMSAARFVNDEFRFTSTHVLNFNATISHGERTLDVALIGKVLPQDSLLLAMSAKMRFYGLAGTQLNIIQNDGVGVTKDDLSGHSVREVYEMAQNALLQKQITIDSLRQQLEVSRSTDSVSVRIAPELKVIFPQISDIAVTPAVFENIADGKSDTVNVAMVKYSRPMSAAVRGELKRYLEARLKVKEVRLVDMGK